MKLEACMLTGMSAALIQAGRALARLQLRCSAARTRGRTAVLGAEGGAAEGGRAAQAQGHRLGYEVPRQHDHALRRLVWQPATACHTTSLS